MRTRKIHGMCGLCGGWWSGGSAEELAHGLGASVENGAELLPVEEFVVRVAGRPGL
jgi:hypothetical protein